MNSTVVTATSAALGSFVGAAASIVTTWMTHRAQIIRTHSEWNLRHRESMYEKFITEASRLAVDALANSLEGPNQLVALYGILSCIRLISGEDVVRQGEACCRRIVELYGRPNLTTDQIRAVVEAHEVDDIDPLKEFSIACRIELLARQW